MQGSASSKPAFAPSRNAPCALPACCLVCALSAPCGPPGMLPECSCAPFLATRSEPIDPYPVWETRDCARSWRCQSM